MKKLLKNIALMAVAAISVVSCAKSDFDENSPTTENGTVIYAKTASTNQTKVDFTDNGTEGIALEWEVGDSFTIYDSEDVIVGTFSCTDAANGMFVADNDLTLTDGDTYRAEYGSKEELYTPNGNEINDLDAACYMISEDFTYNEGDEISITFEHQMAIITFKFASENRPAKLVFENGSESHTVSYSTIEAANGVYTSHIMVEPCEATSRTLTFSLYANESDTEPYDVRTATTSNAYLAGYRYTATVSDLEDITWEGDGSDSNPYKITSTEQLRLLSTNVDNGTTYEGKYFELTKSIDLNGSEDNQWTPIGSTTSFNGTFDGGNNTISGLYINSTSNSQGLFGSTQGGTIKNLTVSGEVTGAGVTGGIVGAIYYSSIINCNNQVNVTGSGANVGGIVGYCYESSIINSSNNAAVNGKSQYTGGITGQLTNTSTALECYNNGSVQGSDYVGGIAGYTNTADNITNCYNLAKVSGTSDIGGIAGKIMSAITNCYNIGTVSATQYRVGGIVGYADATSYYTGSVINCYNDGSVSGEEVVGGIAGSVNGAMNNCYNTREITSNNTKNAGSITGYTLAGTIENCYYNSEIHTGNAIGGGSYTGQITPCETSEMKSDAFVILLNNGAYSYNESTAATEACAWVMDDSYPIFNYDGTPEYTADPVEVTVAQLLAGNYPDSNSWIITDSEIEYAEFYQELSSENLEDRLITITLSNATSVAASAFVECNSIKAVYLPEATYVGNDAFYSCSSIETISLPKITNLSEQAFYNCGALTNLELPLLSTFNTGAFDGCSSLKELDLPSIINMPVNCDFYSANSSLEKITMTNLETINTEYAFGDLSKLNELNVPKLREINKDWVLTGNGSLTTIDMPNLTKLNAYAFCDGQYTTIKLPSLSSIEDGTTFYLDMLEYLDISAQNLTIANVSSLFTINNGTSSTECKLILNSDQKVNVTNDNVWNGITWGSISFVD